VRFQGDLEQLVLTLRQWQNAATMAMKANTTMGGDINSGATGTANESSSLALPSSGIFSMPMNNPGSFLPRSQ
jgi:hypothetical protein